jgi:exodeoxyribonuclease-3
VKVATWNVNSLTARWVRVEEWLTTHDVDVVLLQETKQNDAKFPFDAFTALGYESCPRSD